MAEFKSFCNKFLTIQLPRGSPAGLSGSPRLNLLWMTLCESDLQGHRRRPGRSEQSALLCRLVISVFSYSGSPGRPWHTACPPPPGLTCSVESSHSDQARRYFWMSQSDSRPRWEHRTLCVLSVPLGLIPDCCDGEIGRSFPEPESLRTLCFFQKIALFQQSLV